MPSQNPQRASKRTLSKIEQAMLDHYLALNDDGEFENPPSNDDELHEFIEEHVNPKIAAHRGHISLHRIDGRTVYLEMGGSCQGCGMAAMTLRQNVETQIRARFPDLVEIVDVTNHDEGENPFYER